MPQGSEGSKVSFSFLLLRLADCENLAMVSGLRDTSWEIGAVDMDETLSRGIGSRGEKSFSSYVRGSGSEYHGRRLQYTDFITDGGSSSRLHMCRCDKKLAIVKSGYFRRHFCRKWQIRDHPRHHLQISRTSSTIFILQRFDSD